MTKQRVFVAGHRGMVGSAIVRQLEQRADIELVLHDRTQLDLLDSNAVQAFFRDNQIDQVYLAAAKVGGIVANNTYPAEFIYQNLMIEANIKASDRGRIWIGQKAKIEITAYDYAKYGMIEGELISISPDSFTTQKGEIFYAVKIKAEKDRFGPNFPIMPGMEAGINIITGKRTVLEYILFPLKRISKNALLEP